MSSAFARDTYYVINSQTPKEKYRERKGETKTVIHWGQRKLFLTVLQFMTRYVDLGDENGQVVPKIVYAGAAPGHNIHLLSMLFPTAEFHLYDTNPFSKLLDGNPKITIYKQLFLDEDAAKWTDKPDVYLISDIRRDIAGLPPQQSEPIIQGDMEMQMKWFEIMRPKQAHLKFHLPYTGFGLGDTTDYLDGTVFLQAWRGPSSTECRLVPSWGKRKIWSNIDYEDQNFYINSMVREKHTFANPLDGSNKTIDGVELLNDFDSTTELCILLDYLKRVHPNYGTEDSLRQAVKLSQILTNIITFDINGSKVTLSRLRKDPLLLKPKNKAFGDEYDISEGTGL